MFLRKRDYFSEIREQDLDTILEQSAQVTAHTPEQVRQDNELNMEDIMKTMLRHRYDVQNIFKPIISFVLADTYQIGDLVEYSEPAWDRTATYVATNRVSFETEIEGILSDDIYEANTSIAANEDPLTEPTKWDKKVKNKSLYFAERTTTNILPTVTESFTEDNFTGNYDRIEGWNKSNTLYFLRKETRIFIFLSTADRDNEQDAVGVINFDPTSTETPSRLRQRNRDSKRRFKIDEFDRAIKEFPTDIPIEFGDDRENSLSGTLSIKGFIPDGQTWEVTATNNWTEGDNRSRLIKKILVNLCIFELHKLINPRNIPDLRGEAKDDAMALLKKISDGKIDADLPVLFEEQQGQSITFDSNPRLNHQY